MIHELKTLPHFFEDVLRGDKQFECRNDDRGFRIGDELLLREHDPKESCDGDCRTGCNGEHGYTGRILHRKVIYVLRGEWIGIKQGYCVMGLANL